MKCIFDAKNMSITFDDEARRAIRFVRGLNPDLHVKIRDRQIENSLWFYLDQNKVYIFGPDIITIDCDPAGENWKNYERLLNTAVNIILH